MENSEERVRFLNERLMLLQTVLPVYTDSETYKLELVKKEITYLKSELRHSNYLSFNQLL